MRRRRIPPRAPGERSRRSTGGLAGPRSRGSADRVPARALVRRGVQHGQLLHPLENGVAALARPVRIQHRQYVFGARSIPARSAASPAVSWWTSLRSRRARLLPSPDGEGTALAEIDLVQIGFEDLRLGIPPFDQDRQPGFLQLAQDRPARASAVGS